MGFQGALGPPPWTLKSGSLELQRTIPYQFGKRFSPTGWLRGLALKLH